MINTRSAAAFSIGKASCKVASKFHWQGFVQSGKQKVAAAASDPQALAPMHGQNQTDRHSVRMLTPTTTLHHSTLKSLAKVGFCFIVIAVE